MIRLFMSQDKHKELSSRIIISGHRNLIIKLYKHDFRITFVTEKLLL